MVALFRFRGGLVERFGRGGTIADDCAEAARTGLVPLPSPDQLEFIGTVVTSQIAGVDGEIAGGIRTGAVDVRPGDRILLTSDGIHGVVEEGRLMSIGAGGAAALNELREELGRSGNARAWPSAVLLEIS